MPTCAALLVAPCSGTWSDGKLTTRIGRNSDPVRRVLAALHKFGAPEVGAPCWWRLRFVLWEGRLWLPNNEYRSRPWLYPTCSAHLCCSG